MAKSFRTQADFRRWLEGHHASEPELMMRLFKVHARHRGIGYREALDEALCFGWIDGVRRGLDDDSFTQRFTPRKTKSNWSTVNVKRFRELEAEGRVHAAGQAAFDRHDGTRPMYSFEQRDHPLDPALLRRFKGKKRAWAFFSAQPPGYRRIAMFYVMSAKRPETRQKRLAIVMAHSAKGERLPMLGGGKQPAKGG